MTNRPYKSDVLYDYNVTVCPVCGGRIKHPYTGHVTSEQMDEDSECCLWMEVCDEGDGCLGYTPLCKNVHPWTEDNEDHQYVHYDVLELVNCKDCSLADKIKELTDLIFNFSEIDVGNISFDTDGNNVTAIKINGNIPSINVDLTWVDEDVIDESRTKSGRSN